VGLKGFPSEKPQRIVTLSLFTRGRDVFVILVIDSFFAELVVMRIEGRMPHTQELGSPEEIFKEGRPRERVFSEKTLQGTPPPKP